MGKWFTAFQRTTEPSLSRDNRNNPYCWPRNKKALWSFRT